MAPILKVKARWDGFAGAPGWSNFFLGGFVADPPTTQEAIDAAARVRTFFDAIKGAFPAAVKINLQSDVEIIDEGNGELLDIRNAGVQASIAGTNTTPSFSGPTGMVVTWRTAGVRNGRRVRGRTFLVPVSSGLYEADGTINNTMVTTVSTAANGLLADTGHPDLGIWSRPSASGATDGGWYPVTSATVPDKVAVLRSRRD